MVDRLHNVLAAVHRAVKNAPAPLEPEGPRPVFHQESAYLELARWICAEVEPKIADPDQELWRALLPIVDEPSRTKADSARLSRLFVREGYGLAIPESSPGTTVLLGAAMEAYGRVSGKGSRAAAVAAVGILGAPFIRRLDREILRLEAVTLLRKQSIPVPHPVVETCWRGATGVKTTHMIVRLGDGSYGLVGKARGRWAFTAGSRDDIVASLPEQQMESAVARLLGAGAGEGTSAVGARTRATLIAQVTPDFPVRRLVRVGPAVVAVGAKKTERAAWRLHDGAPLDEAPEVAPGAGVVAVAHAFLHFSESVKVARPTQLQAVAPDGRVASWRWGPGHAVVSVRSPRGQPALELRTAQGNITRVAFAGADVLVAHAGGKRLATFDAQGVQRHFLDGRDLGETIDELVPLSSGRVFAFAPYPRGHVLVVDPDGRALGGFKLGKFHEGCTTALIDAGDRVVFTCSSSRRLTPLIQLVVLGIPAAQT